MKARTRHRVALASALWLSAGVLACSEASEPSPGPAPPPSPASAAAPTPEIDPAIARAQASARALGKALKVRLVAAMAEGGPESALELCSTEAQPLTAAAAAEAGVKLGRASLRSRNRDNIPPPWVRAWLEEQGERPVEGAVGVAERVSEGETASVHVLIPIGVEAPCLVCHGDPNAIPVGVRSLLAARYPQDQAVGYALGDLRGALWVEAPLEASSIR